MQADHGDKVSTGRIIIGIIATVTQRIMQLVRQFVCRRGRSHRGHHQRSTDRLLPFYCCYRSWRLFLA